MAGRSKLTSSTRSARRLERQMFRFSGGDYGPHMQAARRGACEQSLIAQLRKLWGRNPDSRAVVGSQHRLRHHVELVIEVYVAAKAENEQHEKEAEPAILEVS